METDRRWGDVYFLYRYLNAALRIGSASIKRRYIERSMGSKVAPGILCSEISQRRASRIGTQV